MQNISVYLNERASNGSQDWQNKISTALFRSHIEYQSPVNLHQLYEQLDLDIKNHVDAVLSVGGDGTAHSIIQRLAGTDVGLLVVPGGTANDLARTLGSSTNVKMISQTIRHNVRKKIDLIRINGTFMATNGGLGFAADVAKEINDLRKEVPQFKNFMKLSGKNIYSLFLSKRLLSKEIKSHNFQITSNEFSGEISSPLILINNQPALGGDFQVAPLTEHSDGTVNLTIFKHENRLDLISAIIKILKGDFPFDDKNIISFETKEARIDLLDSGKLNFFGDGEIFSETNSWEIRCFHQFLSVYSPKDQEKLINLCTQVSLKH